MSAVVAIINNDSTVDFTRVNWDGYPECLGKALVEGYADEADVRELIKGGEIRSLTPGSEVEYYPNTQNFPTLNASYVTGSGDFTYYYTDDGWFMGGGDCGDPVAVEDYLNGLRG